MDGKEDPVIETDMQLMTSRGMTYLKGAGSAESGPLQQNYFVPGMSRSSMNDDRELFFLQSECSYLFQSKNYNDLIPVLADLKHLQHNVWFKLETKLMISECTMRTKTESECRKCIDEVIEMVKSEFGHEVNDLLYLAHEYTKRSWHFLSMQTYICACKLHLLDSSNSAIVGVAECFRNIRSGLENMEEFSGVRVMAVGIVASYMEEILQDLVKLEEIDPRVRAENESICLNNTGIVFFIGGKNEAAEDYYLKAKRRMETAFKETAQNFYVYGAIINNLGCIEAGRGCFSKARSYFEKAVNYWKRANNFPSEKQRNKWVRSGERSLSSVK